MAEHAPREGPPEEPTQEPGQGRLLERLKELEPWQQTVVAIIGLIGTVTVAIIGVIAAQGGGDADKSRGDADKSKTVIGAPSTNLFITRTILDHNDNGDFVLRVRGIERGLPENHVIYAVAEPDAQESSKDPETADTAMPSANWLVAKADEDGGRWAADVTLPEDIRLPVSVRAVYYETCAADLACNPDYQTILEEYGPFGADGFSKPDFSPTIS